MIVHVEPVAIGTPYMVVWHSQPDYYYGVIAKRINVGLVIVFYSVYIYVYI